MAEHTLPIRSVHKASIPKVLSAHFALSRESCLYRPLTFLNRNLRAFLRHHQSIHEKHNSPSTATKSPRQKQKSSNLAVEPPPEPFPGKTVSETGLDLFYATPLVDAVSRKTLMVKTMDPDYESNARRSLRRLTQHIFDDDEAELTLAPISIRRKINFKDNRPEEVMRPRKRFKADHNVQRAKCNCTLTIWGNRDEESAAVVERRISCTATWSVDESIGHVVDIETDKPFKIRAGDLKVPIIRDGEEILGLSDNYFMEMKIYPVTERKDWPPIPLLGKSDGDVNRRNRSAHSVLSGSLVAKYKNLPKIVDKDTPLSVFYLDNSGVMLRTKFGLEIFSEWKASTTPLEPGPLNHALSFAVDDDGCFLGRKKRSRAVSSLESPPKRREVDSSQSVPNHKQAQIRYFWEPESTFDATDAIQTTEFTGLGCPACPTYDAQDIMELRFHFLNMHSRFNFILSDESYNEAGELISATFRVSVGQPSRVRLDDEKHFEFQPEFDHFDLAAYINGDSSWTARLTGKQRAVPPAKKVSRALVRADSQQFASSSASTSDRLLVPDPLVAMRAKNHGHLPHDQVPEFRQPSRPKYKPIDLVRVTDTKTTSYDSVSHRPVAVSEDEMSETDDERDDEWYIQRHLENLDVDAQEFQRGDMKQEFFRRWDRHRLEEKLDHVVFLSESLIRFVKRNRAWLKAGNNDLKAAFGSFTQNLTKDRLINAQVERDVRWMIFQDNRTSEDESMDMDHPMTNGTTHHDDDASLASTRPTAYRATSPTTALSTWSSHLATVPSNACGICTDTITCMAADSIRCTARTCSTPAARFHFACVKLRKPRFVAVGTFGGGGVVAAGNRKSLMTNGSIGGASDDGGAVSGPERNWTCMGCRLEAQENGKGKGKGKGRAIMRDSGGMGKWNGRA